MLDYSLLRVDPITTQVSFEGQFLYYITCTWCVLTRRYPELQTLRLLVVKASNQGQLIELSINHHVEEKKANSSKKLLFECCLSSLL